MKKQKGITLVALVISIIILLILAGISIQALTNQGIFGRANEAKRESEIANIKEQIALDIYEKQLEPPLGSITEEQLEEILGKYGTVNKEDGKIVGITTAKGYEILLKDIYGGETVAESVPDGATVTPVNDITTWLKTGEISKQYSYTTIEQVIADSTCTESLMKNENSMKYLARSTEFADAICTSETAMTSLGKSAYVDDTVLNSDLWSSAICDSTYFEQVLNVKVPTMTGYTTPTGEVIYGNAKNPDDWRPWYVFCGDTTKSGVFNNNCYIGYKFTKPVIVKKVKTYNIGSSQYGTQRTKSFKIEASNNETDWVSLGVFENTNNTVDDCMTESKELINYYNINNNTAYLYYRFAPITNYGWNGTNSINKLQFYGRV